jgi:TatD DNase family protein
MLIDTHAHLNFNAYKDDAPEVVRRSLAEGIWTINVGSQYSTSRRAIQMAKEYGPGVFAAVGLHPIHLAKGIFKTKVDQEEIEFETREEEFDYEKYKALAQDEKVVAIGEIGLDYWYKPKSQAKLSEFKDLQIATLKSQIQLAKELDLPIIFHCRLAQSDLLKILKEEKGVKGVIHCFTGNLAEAKEFLSLGFYLGFNGIIFKLNLDEVIKEVPLDKIVLETDCPYLTPPLKEGRNEPSYIKYVAEKIAKLKNLSYQEVSDITTQNAKKLFKIS